MSGLGGSTGTGTGTSAIAKSRVVVYDEKGREVGLDLLKNKDLLVIYWKKAFDWSITVRIQGVDHHSSLMEFYSLGALETLMGRCFEWSGNFPLDQIDRIQLAGHDTTGRILMFVNELNDQRLVALETLGRIRKNIDKLKS